MLVKPDIQLHEVSTGGVVEKVDEWSRRAGEHAAYALQLTGSNKDLFEVVERPLSAADAAVLEQHAALYALVAASAYGAQQSRYAAWRERAQRFDFTLGPGLRELAQRQHVDAAVFLVGSDYISSAGRKAAMAFGVVLAALTGVIVAPPTSPAFMSIGVVDLQSGDLIWFSTDVRTGSQDLRDEAVMQSIVDGLLQTYPASTSHAAQKK